MEKLLLNPGTGSIKKILFSLTMLMLLTLNLFSQDEAAEKKLKVKELELRALTTIPTGNIDCKCEKNILKDGGFENLTTYSGSSNIATTSSPWKPNTYSPQWSPTLGCCEKGLVSMWGNQTVGESIIQNGLTIVSGRKYAIKFTARFANPTSLSTFVKLKMSAFNGSGTTSYNSFPASDVIFTSANISSTTCATYNYTWTATNNFNSIQLHPENAYSQNDGAYVSWVQLDNICMVELRDSCDCIQYPQKPAITGTTLACACDPIKFSTLKCPGAIYSWTVKDNKGNTIATTGGTTNAISLNYSLAQQVASGATSFTVTVTIKCGDKNVTNTITVPLKPIPKTNVSFSLTDDGAGNYTATATGMAPGNGNGWTLKEVNCPGPNPCSWAPGPIKWQSTGNSIAIPNGVLVKGKCYVLTHYVNVCSATWIAGPCTVYKATCFKLDGNQMRMPAARETDKNDALEITAEMLGDLRSIK